MIHAEKVQLSKSNHTTVYDEVMKKNVLGKVNKEFAVAILQSALDDADYEFLTDDYFEWKKYRLQRKRKNQNITEMELHREFKYIKEYRDVLFAIAETSVGVKNISPKVIEQRKLYENNRMCDLKKLTGYNEIVLDKISKLHGWKIGINYQEPTIFDI